VEEEEEDEDDEEEEEVVVVVVVEDVGAKFEFTPTRTFETAQIGHIQVSGTSSNVTSSTHRPWNQS
jgi:hypothetical protein|tara:strand:+ start:82 stop:279 length:198 start_codon:yes stop_codon:yes gene_type:complete